MPERDVFFNGLTGKPTDAPMFDMEPRIVYPMEGGTALITFEEEVGEFMRKLYVFIHLYLLVVESVVLYVPN